MRSATVCPQYSSRCWSGICGRRNTDISCAPDALAYVAKLRSELRVHCDCMGQPPLPDALCDGTDASPDVVQLRAPVFGVVASAIDCLDGGERIGGATGCVLRDGVFPSELDLHLADPGAHRPRDCSSRLGGDAQEHACAVDHNAVSVRRRRGHRAEISAAWTGGLLLLPNRVSQA